MDLTSTKVIKEIFLKYETSASKRLGQNFLIDKRVLENIVSVADLNKADVVLEIGPGIGTLTQELAKKAKRVVAVEKDTKMVDILKETLANFDNVEIVNEDILKYKVDLDNYKVVANIPYYLTSILIRQLLENDNPPSNIILTIQKEVAQRICAKVPDMNLLAISVQFYADVKIREHISKNSFWPSPKIDSAVIEIKPSAKNIKTDFNLFFKIVKAGFSHPRKQLVNNLTSGLKISREVVEKWLSENNIKPSQRAETLDVKDWISLTNSYKY